MAEECKMAEVLLNGWQNFAISQEMYRKIADDFAAEISAGLAGKTSSLMMLPAYVGRPSGCERGNFLSLDFGGTNVRVAEVNLDGAGGVAIGKIHKEQLNNPAEGYDFTRPEVHVTELFDFLARQVALFNDGSPKVLGHSFSFASKQTSLGQAALVGWTKEIRVCGVNGQDINALLAESLARQNCSNIKPVAVVNDTTATLLAASYAVADADLGSVCGTGHNTCYFEPDASCAGGVMAYNAESGGFDRLNFTTVDDQLDADSDHPGQQRLEKMVSGRYLGEITRRLLWTGRGQCGLGFVEQCDVLQIPYGLSSQDVSLFIGDETGELEQIRDWFASRAPGVPTTAAERHFIREVAATAAQRSAMLASATYAAFLQRIDPAKGKKHCIGINGSLYEKMPGFAECIKNSLQTKGGWTAEQISFLVVDEAPLVGAAIAASLAKTKGGAC